ncbi:hypothetical protein AVEN_232587-1 [Araneus ventricosus]|uniref:DNA helicase Pif1-like 2B domain-containing protein n=1 Tax=Araneus ventricosus TaxID=182803 RepID=A0A4Y2MBM0_ARAVE|nr:hypothetical protein AVEN_232587-1 [Araneus ventricosus]
MENSWAVPTHLLQSEGVANDLSDTIASDFPLESERKLDVFQYVATNWAVHTYDNSCSYNRRKQRAREFLDERFQRRLARNTTARLRRARERSEQQMANRVNSQFKMNVSEHDCGESGEKIQLPPFCYPEIQDPVQQLFSDIDFKTVTPEELKGRAILTVTNDLSIQINNRVLECMPVNEVIYESMDNIVSNDPQDQLAYTEAFLNSLTPNGIPPHKLKLKPGVLIMLLRNLAPSKGLCNGSRLIVIQLQKNVIVASKKISADNNNKSYHIPLIPYDSNMPFQFMRKQFPIRLAF